MICTNCLQSIFPKPKNIQQLKLSNIGINEDLKKLNCPECKICMYLSKTENDWGNIDSWLYQEKNKNGWHEVQEREDLLKFFILSQIVHNEIESEIDNVIFDFPDKTDLIKILWNNGNAIGFYTIKPKDSFVLDTMETYGMSTLDTAFIRKSHRKKGFGLSILEDVIRSFPNEHIGISTPISESMYFVVYKFLSFYPTYRMKLWEITGVGSEGNRKLIFLTIKNLFDLC